VREVIKGMDRDKAPSSDGFSSTFYQNCWEVVKGDFMAIFADFHSQGKFVKSINSTLSCLFLKFMVLRRLRIFALLALWVMSIRL
jgi:hypothetical protein